jgi:hypothetical protein
MTALDSFQSERPRAAARLDLSNYFTDCKKVTAQVFRLKAEGYATPRKARIKPFKTLTQMPEVLCDHTWFVPESLQPSVYLPE